MKKCSYCGAEYPDDVAACVLDRTSLDVPPSSSSIHFQWAALFSWGGLLFSILINASIVYGCLPFFFWHQDLGPGTIFWFISLFKMAILTFLIGVPCAIVAIKKRRRRVGWLGLVLALTPAPLGLILLRSAMYMNGIQFD